MVAVVTRLALGILLGRDSAATRRRIIFAAGVLLGLVVGQLQAAPAASIQPSHHSPIPFDSWHPIPSPAASADASSPRPAGTVPTSATPRAREPQPSHDAASASMPASLSGRATWLCNATHPEVKPSPCTRGYPDTAGVELYAAAGPALRAELGNWRGRTVVVCRKQSCIAVRLIDSCVCPSVVDLYADAFAQLAPLSTGVIPVTISRQTP